MNLKYLREQRGFTQAEFAEKAGVSAVSVCRYESGEREPDLATLRRLADVLAVSVDELLGEQEGREAA